MPILVESILGVKGEFALAEGKLLKDVIIHAPTLSYRDSIPLFVRQWNMIVFSGEDDTFYQLTNNHVDDNLNNNANWKVKKLGGSSPINGLKTIGEGIGLGGNLTEDTIIDSPLSKRLGVGTNSPLKSFDVRANEVILNGLASTAINGGTLSLNSQSVAIFTSNADMLFLSNAGINFQAITNLLFSGNVISIGGNEVRYAASKIFNDTSYFKLPERNAAALPNNLANLVYDSASSRIAWNDGTRNYYAAHLDDVNPKSNYNISFGQKNWVGANVLFKCESVADLYFHTIKRESILKSVVLNTGEVGTGELSKTVTIVIYKALAYSWNISSERIRSMTELQASSAQQIFAMTTAIAGSDTSNGWDFQRIFDSLNITLNPYYKLFVGITTNQYSTLNNVSVTLEIEDK